MNRRPTTTADGRQLLTAVTRVISFLTLFYSAEAYVVDGPSDGTKVYIPAINPENRQIKFYPVVSRYLVVDPYRNPRHNVTICSYTDFLEYPNMRGNSHFIPIANTGHGMTLFGRSAESINAEINRIVQQLPEEVWDVTFYQYKDVNRFPNHNVFSGKYLKTHLPPHQDFYRAKRSRRIVSSR